MKGYFNLMLDGQILISHINGQWSAETALQYDEDIRQLVARLSVPTFAHLLFFSQWELSTPQSQAISQKTVSWLIDKGMCVSAEVFASDNLKEFVLKKVRSETKGSLSIQRFDNKIDALNWLASQGFNLNNKSAIDLEII